MRRLNWSRSRSNERQLDLRGYVTTATDAENQFLENMPGEIKEVLQLVCGWTIQGPSQREHGRFRRAILGRNVRGRSGSFPRTSPLLLLRC